MRDRSEGTLQPFFDGFEFEGLLQITSVLTAVFGGAGLACPSPRRLERAQLDRRPLFVFDRAGRTTRKPNQEQTQRGGRDVGADITGLEVDCERKASSKLRESLHS